MKTSLLVCTTAALCVASSLALAAPEAGKTRADVRAELKALQDAGYTRNGDKTRYPANLHMAQAKLDSRQAATSPAGSMQHDAGISGKEGAMPANADSTVAKPSKMTRMDARGLTIFDSIYRGQ